jgi:hypothetical protein
VDEGEGRAGKYAKDILRILDKAGKPPQHSIPCLVQLFLLQMFIALAANA